MHHATPLSPVHTNITGVAVGLTERNMHDHIMSYTSSMGQGVFMVMMMTKEVVQSHS